MITNYQSESDSGHRHHVICWRSALAGLVIGLLTFSGVVALSMAFGGIGLSDGTSAKNAGAFVGITMTLAVMLGTFVGSYFSARISKHVVDVVGCMQGMLVGGLLILLILCQTLSAVGAIGKVASSALGARIEATATASAEQGTVIPDAETREATATALKNTGWGVFVIIVLGTIASVLGGLLATKCNERYLVDVPDSLKKARS